MRSRVDRIFDSFATCWQSYSCGAAATDQNNSMASKTIGKGKCCGLMVSTRRRHDRKRVCTSAIQNTLTHAQTLCHYANTSITLLHGVGQFIHLFLCIIKRKARACRRRHIEKLHYRLGTVVAGANGDAFLVEDRADVVRMNIFDSER